MKTKHLLLLVLIVVLGSCSSAFKTGPTPDDVYYSPAPPPPVEYVSTENQQDRDAYANHNAYNNEDPAIRGGNSNVSLDFGFGYSPYDYYGSSLYSPYSPYYNSSYTGVTFYPHNYNYYGYYSPYNNNYGYYSPFNNYYSPVYLYNNSSPVSNYSGPRTYNLGAYNNTTGTNRVFSHPGEPAVTNNAAPVRTFRAQQPANGSGVGNFIRRVLTPSNNTRSYSNDNINNNSNNNSNNSSPARNIQVNTSSSSSSSSRSSGGSSAPVRSFR